MRWLLWLYPRAGRRRYGAELAALVEDSGTGWRDLVNVAGTGLGMRVVGWWPMVAGALVGAGLSYCMTPFRVSSWAMSSVGYAFTPGQFNQIPVRDSELVKVIEKHGLMRRERQWLPPAVVTFLFRRAITIKGLDGAIEASYVGPETNTRVAIDLILSVNSNLFPKRPSGTVFRVRSGDCDGEPRRPHPVALPIFGALVGFAVGGLGRYQFRAGKIKDRGRS